MPNILTIAYFVEGPTDARFLENVIQRTFEEIALTCMGDIDVYQAQQMANPKKDSFVGNILEIADHAFEMGIHVLCIHTDADDSDDTNAFNNKINPAFGEVEQSNEDICKNLVAIVPVRMSEAWMLADRDLFREEIGAGNNDDNARLNIARPPETIADPKTVIEEAIRIVQQGKPRKARDISISDIYQPIGQKISLEALQRLPSYRKFQLAAEQALRALNYLH